MTDVAAPLARARRLRMLDDAMRIVLAANPSLPARVSAMLSDPEGLTMADPAPLSLRLPADLLSRIDALVRPIEADAELVTIASPTGSASRSMVIRLALVEGVRVLEARYGKKGVGRASRK